MKRVAIVITLLCLPLAHANDERRNPFAHTLEEDADSGPAAVASAEAVEPKLSAILVAGDASLVTLNGNVIGLGEEALGYTLVSVTEESAALLQNDEVIHLQLFDDEETDSRNSRD